MVIIKCDLKGGENLLIHSIIYEQDVRESFIKSFAITDTLGLRFKFYTDWEQFWIALDASLIDHAADNLVLCCDREPERKFPEGCKLIKLTKRVAAKPNEVFLYQPVDHFLSAIKCQLSGSEEAIQTSMRIKWILSPRLGETAIKQIENLTLRRIAKVGQSMIINLSPWRIPAYLCPETNQLSVSDYLLTHRAFKSELSQQSYSWPTYISKYKHPLDLLWINESALNYLEKEGVERGAKEMTIISGLLSSEAMKWLALKANSVSIINENHSDDSYKDQYMKWISFYHPDVSFFDNGEDVIS